MHEPVSFWQENIIAIIILLYEFRRECHSGRNGLSNVTSSFILRSREGLTSFNKDNSTNFSGESKVQ